VRPEEPPETIVVGFAMRLATGLELTVTVAFAVAEPLEFVHVSVYVVVPDGDTTMGPDPDGLTAP
jgi:hypothetical protein